MKIKWEPIEKGSTLNLRAKVPGGWLICSSFSGTKKLFGFFPWPVNNICMTFVPDQNHEWGIEE